MKGLLIKDLQLLKNQKSFFVVLAVIIVFYAALGNVIFILSYTPIMCVFVAMSTITYDTYDNGSAFLFTMPFSRKKYVWEKYLFSGAIVLISWGISLAVALGYTSLRAGDWKEVLAASIVFLVMALCIMGLSIPLQLKFGAEKSRAAVIITMAAAFGGLMVIFKIMEKMNVNSKHLWLSFSAMKTSVLTVAALVIMVVLLMISFSISAKIMMKKEM